MFNKMMKKKNYSNDSLPEEKSLSHDDNEENDEENEEKSQEQELAEDK